MKVSALEHEHISPLLDAEPALAEPERVRADDPLGAGGQTDEPKGAAGGQQPPDCAAKGDWAATEPGEACC